MKILVLAGGLSPERDVSLTSGSLIAGALARRGHSVCAADLYTGLSIHGDTPLFSTEPIPPYTVGRQVPDLEALKIETGYGDHRIAPNIPPLWREADAVFIALHGDVGENGQLQAALDMESIPYTGSGYAGSLLAMDKDLSKQIMTRAGIPTAPWVFCRLSRGISAAVAMIEGQIGYPCVVKPCACGSSVGVSIVHERDSLIEALRAVAVYEDTVLAERMIVGRELTVSVLGDQVLPPVEIIPKAGFYDYHNKYQAGCTEEICPAELEPATVTYLSQLSKNAFEALRLGGYARFDFILDGEGTPWCLEANTLPGMTPTSLLPLSAAAAGMDYETLCETMILMAVENKKD